jgi:hypothetical protein
VRKYQGIILTSPDSAGLGTVRLRKRILKFSEEDLMNLQVDQGDKVEFNLIENRPVEIIKPGTKVEEIILAEAIKHYEI